MELTLKQGSQRFTLNQDTNITTLAQTHHALVLDFTGIVDASLNVIMAPGSQLDMFCFNTADALSMKETFTLQQDAILNLSYGDLTVGDTNRSVQVSLQGKGSKVQLNSATLISKNTDLRYQFSHQAQFTQGDMKNYAVMVKDGNLSLYAIGHIEKTGANSETHQSTRVLNLEGSKKAAVYPHLIIDNNEVQASHAESTGQMDDDHLYYLQSRGLSEAQAIRLMVKGYLSSVTESISDEALKSLILEKIDQKVEEIC
jgi:Fe-S cluster assembly scaffold protein SufB